jgi:hypothetical protein
MAELIKTDGSRTEVNPRDGVSFHLDELYEMLSCHLIEVVDLPCGKILIIDEEGKITEKPTNQIATMMYAQLSDWIAGDCIVCASNQLQ